jgi:hypothetical protein
MIQAVQNETAIALIVAVERLGKAVVGVQSKFLSNIVHYRPDLR